MATFISKDVTPRVLKSHTLGLAPQLSFCWRCDPCEPWISRLQHGGGCIILAPRVAVRMQGVHASACS